MHKLITCTTFGLLACVGTSLAAIAPAKNNRRGLSSSNEDKNKVEAVSTHTIDQWRVGEIINGEQIKLDDMKGKVVIIEFWGVNCPPCIASLPELAKLYKSKQKDGLMVIGVHCQGGSKEAVNEVLKKHGVTYPVAANGQSAIQFRGIPRAFVFDKEGKLIYDGSPLDEKMKKTALQAL